VPKCARGLYFRSAAQAQLIFYGLVGTAVPTRCTPGRSENVKGVDQITHFRTEESRTHLKYGGLEKTPVPPRQTSSRNQNAKVKLILMRVCNTPDRKEVDLTADFRTDRRQKLKYDGG
jgi:hypothetical protein